MKKVCMMAGALCALFTLFSCANAADGSSSSSTTASDTSATAAVVASVSGLTLKSTTSEEYTYYYAFTSNSAGTLTKVKTATGAVTTSDFTYDKDTGAVTIGTDTMYLGKIGTGYVIYSKTENCYTRSDTTKTTLFTTWVVSGTSKTLVLNSDGTATGTKGNGTAISGVTYTNDSGIIKASYNGSVINVSYYDGTHLYNSDVYEKYTDPVPTQS